MALPVSRGQPFAFPFVPGFFVGLPVVNWDMPAVLGKAEPDHSHFTDLPMLLVFRTHYKIFHHESANHTPRKTACHGSKKALPLPALSAGQGCLS